MVVVRVTAADDVGAAFADVYDAHAAALYRYAVRRAGAGLAEDLVAETFAAAFAGRDAYDARRGEIRAWLFGILTRRIARHYRDESARLRMMAAVPAPAVSADVAERAAEMVSAAALRGELAAAVAGLGAGDRDVLLLVAWADLAYHEVAEVLGIPVGTVRSRLNRARRILRDRLPHVEDHS